MGDRNQGRKPLPPDEQTKPRSVRLNDERWEKLKRLGGAEWLRRAIDRAKEPSASSRIAGQEKKENHEN